MKRILKRVSQTLLLVPALAIGVSFVAAPVANVAAADDATYTLDGSKNASKPDDVPTNFEGNQGIIKTIVNIMLYIIGIACVIMLIYGGIRYATSGGNEKGITSGKNTIMYAIIGLIIAILAYAIVNFVIGGIGGEQEE
jgi:hypothetical protein